MLVVGLAALVAFAAEEVTSVNVVGYNKVAVPPGKLVMAHMPFLDMGDASVENVVGSQLPANSALHLWDDSANAYVTTIRKTTRSGTAWTPNVDLPRGKAFWIEVPGAVGTNAVILPGEVPESRNFAATSTVAIAPYDMVGYAYPVDMPFTNTSLFKNSAADDALNVWDVNSQTYATYIKKATRSGTSWQPSVDSLVIKVGQSFWYQPKSGSVNWTEVAPYDLTK
jgi:hypothetical protein